MTLCLIAYLVRSVRHNQPSQRNYSETKNGLSSTLQILKTQFLSDLIIFLYFFHHIPCAISQRDLRLCDSPFHCGNFAAGFPFWGDTRPEPCGHPSLVLHCDQSKNIPYLIISGQMYSVLEIDKAYKTLRLARQDFLGESFCSPTFTGTTLTSEIFELSSDYKTLFVYYLCDARFHYPASFRCPKNGVGSVHKNDENHENCGASFNITVPVSYVPEEDALNLTRLGSVLKEGFNVKVKIDDRPCQECQSSGGICGYDDLTPACCKANSSTGLVIDCNIMIASVSSEISKEARIGIGFTCGFIGATLLAGGLFYFITRRRKKRLTQYTNKNLSTATPYSSTNTMFTAPTSTTNALTKQNLKALIPLKQYSYTEVKRITKSLAEVVGKGGFGTVYKGKLQDGRMVAVKILKKSKGDGEDFINEVASMSKTSHVNIVSLLGFCYDGSKRAIIYEYLENGSLDQFFSSKVQSNKDWRTLYKISLGIARGLEYLHNGCQTRIVHFDIKPQNVLLDGDLCPKVSDFGLAKLCGKRESIMSLLDTRGTIGYIAPEVVSRTYGNVSHKSDVYSYGMLVIEMIGARNRETAQKVESNTSSMYFPDWIYKDLENGDYQKLLGEEVTVEDEPIAKKMIMVGLWCIQSSPSNRPPMNRVIEMLEGSVEDLQVPPKPVLHLSARQFTESSRHSEDSSSLLKT